MRVFPTVRVRIFQTAACVSTAAFYCKTAILSNLNEQAFYFSVSPIEPMPIVVEFYVPCSRLSPSGSS